MSELSTGGLADVPARSLPAASAAPRTAKKRRTRWAIAALVTLVVVVIGFAVFPMIMQAVSPAPAPVASAVVETGQLVVTASADGQAEPAESEEIYPLVSGTVTSVEVAVGDSVKVGDELFTIDDEELQSAVRSAKAQLSQADQQVSQARQQVAQANQQVAQANQQVEQAEFQVMQAEHKLDELESLTGTRSATTAEIDEAEKSVDVARAGLTSARSGQKSAKASQTSAHAGLTSAQTSRSNASRNHADALADVDNAVVVAPSDGIVTQVNVSEGGSTSGGGASSSGGASTAAATGSGGSASSSTGSSAAVVITDTSELIVSVAVNEVDIADVKTGQEATVTFDALNGLTLPAKVTWVSPNAVNDGTVSTYAVELALGEQDPKVRSGMTATADIVTVVVPDAVLVPKSSVKVDGTTKYVTVVTEGGSTEKRTVTTGPSDDTQVQIVTGLRAGEQIASTASSSAPEERNGFMPPAPGGMGGSRPSGAPGGGN
ncbi:MAG: HlyD family efflux transporter periplasmic adaptor subunit [Coriobacteriia bacterium]|nr:HlyD family efflux transporter periplasmic adaptor subunit [Coriobacteriia bacterium]